jgi:signal transduction histidine kinase/Flp pilus assembly protein TadD
MTKKELEALLLEAESFIREGNYTEAETNARWVLEITADEQSATTARAKNIVADCAWRNSRLQEAMEFATSALLDAEESGDASQRALGFANLGTIHRELSLYGEALEHYHEALELFRSLEKLSDIARIMMNIGNVLRQLMQFAEAEEYLGKAQEIFVDQRMNIDVARVLNLRGLICDEHSQPNQALDYYRQALEIFEAEGDVPGNYISMAWLFKNIGNACRQIALYDEAIGFYTSASRYFEESGNRLGGAALKIGLGDLYATTEWTGYNEQTAITLLTQALETLEELGDKHERYKCHRSLAALYEGKEQWKEFALHFKQFFVLEQEVQSDTAHKKAAAAEYEQKIAEIRKEQEVASRYTDMMETLNANLMILNEEKTTFLGIVAHDLKNPLAGIILTAQNVRTYISMLPQQKIAEYMVKIENTSKRMQDTILHLLNINAIESGNLAVISEDFDIAEFTRQAADEYTAKASEKNIRLLVETCPHPLLVSADKNCVHSALDNLISNAIKFSPPGTTVSITYLHSSQKVRINVTDQGPGLTEADKKNLFTKFAKLSAKPTGGEHSSGLGLSIVKKMAEAMNGAVGCESEYGRGATFYLEIPAAH